MLECCPNMTLCGVILYNNCWEEIYADEVGTVVFEPGDGCWIFSEINVPEPLPLDTVSGLVRNLESGSYGDAIGVIYTMTGNIVVLLDEEHAVMRTLDDTVVNRGDVFYYSTDCEYDVEEGYSEED